VPDWIAPGRAYFLAMGISLIRALAVILSALALLSRAPARAACDSSRSARGRPMHW
jgi:hypothetical protein